MPALGACEPWAGPPFGVNSDRQLPPDVCGGRLVSRHGPHLAVGVGSVCSEVLVGGLRDTFALVLPVYLLSSFVVVAFEESDHYVQAAAVTVVAVLVLAYVMVLPGLGRIHLVERWAAGREVDRGEGTGRDLHLGSGGGCSRDGGQRGWGRPASGRCRCDRRGERVAARAVRDPGRSLRSCRPAAGCAQLRGSSDAAGQGGHRR